MWSKESEDAEHLDRVSIVQRGCGGETVIVGLGINLKAILVLCCEKYITYTTDSLERDIIQLTYSHRTGNNVNRQFYRAKPNPTHQFS